MRYYDIQITDIATGQMIQRWTSHPNGIMAAPDRGALNVEFDVIVSPYAMAAGNTGGGDFGQSLIRVWGIPLYDIGQATNWSAPTGAAPTYSVKFFGGMGKGLPLANPSQAGLIVQGYIWRAIGNWIGTEMTLDLFLVPLPIATEASASNPNVPAHPITNLVLNWPQGTPLAAALNATLQTSYPGVPIQISISPNLIATKGEAGIYGTIGALNDYVYSRSVAMLGPGNPQYFGVQITAKNGAILVYDSVGGTGTNSTGGTAAPSPQTINIQFTDLIGQPTWIGNGTVQVTCVLRSDIAINDKVTMPPSVATVTPQAALASPPGTLSQARASSQFQGTFNVTQVRAIGNYKSPQGTAWVTTFSAITPQGAAVAQGYTPPQNTIGASVT